MLVSHNKIEFFLFNYSIVINCDQILIKQASKMIDMDTRLEMASNVHTHTKDFHEPAASEGHGPCWRSLHRECGAAEPRCNRW